MEGDLRPFMAIECHWNAMAGKLFTNACLAIMLQYHT